MLVEQSWPLARQVSEHQPAVGVRCGLVLGRPRVRSPAEKRPGREGKGSAAGGAVLPQRDALRVGEARDVGRAKAAAEAASARQGRKVFWPSLGTCLG